jgi:hypothetical protein
VVQTLSDGVELARRRRSDGAFHVHNFRANVAGNEGAVIHFLEGFILGLVIGFLVSYVAFVKATSKVASDILRGGR